MEAEDGYIETPILLYKIANFKKLLDEVFVISRIIKVEVGVISRSRRLRLITLTMDITNTNIIIVLLYNEHKNLEVMFLPLH